ncbi:hydrolase Nlp/P60 [Gordoniibacillus kamchatkensis]|uniref:Hydrolase Nlp/P60 n=1 Tax=Gordoniibacillus kamchatkensis TaxID=1590651 RepID=A0ABR5AN01_9BACL|nr:NlpC/P60 family protein [Paenibacillus sp. VKM B-2647]KIL42401.1 hydrolase Nlp/P60 [Paenibacillus sp. VKM B-2647]
MNKSTKSFAVKTLRTLALSAAILAAGASGAALFPTARAEAATTSLAQGASGADVSALQTSLKALGYFTYPSVTGYYGTYTMQAVSSFQAAYRLPVTGAADTVTQTAISHAVVKQNLIADTSTYNGVPYVWGGTTPSGFDCSGFVYFMFNKFGVAMPRSTSSELFQTGFAVGRSALQPGDLVFFSDNQDGTVSHVGFYVGGGSFISPTRSAGVKIQSLDNSYWGPRYLGARRVY